MADMIDYGTVANNLAMSRARKDGRRDSGGGSDWASAMMPFLQMAMFQQQDATQREDIASRERVAGRQADVALKLGEIERDKQVRLKKLDNDISRELSQSAQKFQLWMSHAQRNRDIVDEQSQIHMVDALSVRMGASQAASAATLGMTAARTERDKMQMMDSLVRSARDYVQRYDGANQAAQTIASKVKTTLASLPTAGGNIGPLSTVLSDSALASAPGSVGDGLRLALRGDFDALDKMTAQRGGPVSQAAIVNAVTAIRESLTGVRDATGNTVLPAETEALLKASPNLKAELMQFAGRLTDIEAALRYRGYGTDELSSRTMLSRLETYGSLTDPAQRQQLAGDVYNTMRFSMGEQKFSEWAGQNGIDPARIAAAVQAATPTRDTLLADMTKGMSPDLVANPKVRAKLEATADSIASGFAVLGDATTGPIAPQTASQLTPAQTAGTDMLSEQAKVASGEVQAVADDVAALKWRANRGDLMSGWKLLFGQTPDTMNPSDYALAGPTRQTMETGQPSSAGFSGKPNPAYAVQPPARPGQPAASQPVPSSARLPGAPARGPAVSPVPAVSVGPDGKPAIGHPADAMKPAPQPAAPSGVGGITINVGAPNAPGMTGQPPMLPLGLPYQPVGGPR